MCVDGVFHDNTNNTEGEDTAGSGPRSGKPVAPGHSPHVHFLRTEYVHKTGYLEKILIV